jgi:hypothetical protein
MTDAWRQAWVTALDALEADVEAVERMIEDEHRQQDLPAAAPTWEPKPQLGPVPADLRTRAEVILSRQLAAARASAAAMTMNRRQTAFATRVEAGSAGKSVPSYLDRAV